MSDLEDWSDDGTNVPRERVAGKTYNLSSSLQSLWLGGPYASKAVFQSVAAAEET